MEESPDWATLSPEEFAHLQKYLDCECAGSAGCRLGFKLFLRSYLEADDVPDALCRHLFRSFQTSATGQGGAPRTSWSVSGGCAAGEGAPWSRGGRGGPPSPELSLPVTFKLYDKDGNGLLDSSEVDRIITQMMRVAQYLDWDVTELKPILQEMMREIDYDGSGTVSLAEWLRGGVTNIPLLVLLGLEGVSHMKDDGQHMWRLKHFKRPAYCNVCETLLLGLRKQGLCCTCEGGAGTRRAPLPAGTGTGTWRAWGEPGGGMGRDSFGAGDRNWM
uniref:DGKA kinase n=1 Tax=Nothoprocta perdicaria TaxID=30464 RepID=A0A8C6ZEJ8_NOTPE